ncbi:MAG: hypothetical protein ACEQR8_07475 [Cypionkella sp.]
MGFLVLFAVGGVLAWVASIVARGDEGRTIAQFLLAGIVGALLFGGMISEEPLMVGLSARALLAGMAGAILFLAGLVLARARSIV